MCSYGEGELARFLGELMEILQYEHFSPVTGMNSGDPNGIVLLYLLYFADHKHPI